MTHLKLLVETEVEVQVVEIILTMQQAELLTQEVVAEAVKEVALAQELEVMAEVELLF